MAQSIPASGQGQRRQRSHRRLGSPDTGHGRGDRQRLPGSRIGREHAEHRARAREHLPLLVHDGVFERSKARPLLRQRPSNPFIPGDGIRFVILVGVDRFSTGLPGQRRKDRLRAAMADDQPVPQRFQIARQGLQGPQQEVHQGRPHIGRAQDGVVPAEHRDHPIGCGISLPQRGVVGDPQIPTKPMDDRFQGCTFDPARGMFN